MDNYNLDIYKLAREQGLGWVSAQNQISYLVPAFLMEEVTIQTQLLSYTDKSLMVEAFMWNTDKTILKAVMWSKLVHFHLASQKSHSHSEELMQLFEQVANPLAADEDFETRIKKLRSDNAGINGMKLQHSQRL